MNKVLEVINKPADAFQRKNALMSWSFVVLSIFIVVVGDAMINWISTDFTKQMDVWKMIYTFMFGVVSYVTVSSTLFLIGRIFGSKTSWKTYISSWGLTFLPNILCAAIVAYTENYYTFFYSSELWGILFNIIFIGILFWKIILYILFLHEVAGLKGGRLFGSFICGVIVIILLVMVNVRVELKTPVL